MNCSRSVCALSATYMIYNAMNHFASSYVFLDLGWILFVVGEVEAIFLSFPWIAS